MKTNRNIKKIKHAITTILSYKHFKPLLWTIITALCVGVFLGYFVLKIVAEDEYVATENILATDQQDESETEERIELPEFSLFVLQGGVFKETENAENLGKQINQNQGTYAIHEIDNDYYVWLFAASNEKALIQHKEKLAAKDIHTIVKQWDIPKASISLPEQESKWLQLYTDRLSEALQSEEIDQNEWKQLVNEDNPIPSYSAWYEELQSITLQEEVTEERLILQLFIHYEKLINELK